MTIQSLDRELLLLINNVQANGVFDVLMPALSHNGFLLVVPFLFFLFLRGATQNTATGKTFLPAAVWAFLIACCAVYVSGFAEDWLKVAVARVRPCRSLPDIRLLIPCPQSYSLPSGHAMSSFAFAAPLFYLTKGYLKPAWRLYPVILASIIAFSRLYLGVHYPTDALAGAVLGAAIGVMLSIIYLVIAGGGSGKWKNGMNR